ncbi:MAG: type 1 glutamine amidotransferase domain-containing protein [Armatimonadota bacterium]
MHLQGKKVAALVADNFEDSELLEPVQHLREHGAEVVLVGLEAGATYKGKNGQAEVTSDRAIADVEAEEFDAIYIAGGKQPEALRQSDEVIRFVQEFDNQNKPIIAMCHGPQVLSTADLLDGRRITSWPEIESEMRRAGAIWSDEAVVVDGNYVTSRRPSDIPQLLLQIDRVLHKETAAVLER